MEIIINVLFISHSPLIYAGMHHSNEHIWEDTHVDTSIHIYLHKEEVMPEEEIEGCLCEHLLKS